MAKLAKEKVLDRAARVITFIEGYLFIPEGMNVGQPFELDPFQKKFIKEVYSGNPRRVRRAILSMAKKNGKTSLIAALLIVHLVGPEALENTQIISGAQSQEQAALVFDLAVKILNMSDILRPLVRVIASRKRMFGLPMNVEYRALSAEGKTTHGISPVLAILDEVGQVRGSKDPFIDAVITSQGAHENPLLLVISTQAENDTDLLSIWIDDALSNDNDPTTVCHVYAANPKAGVLDEKAWRAANPALGRFRSEKDIRELASQASRMPSFENSFRNLYLNQRISSASPFVSREVWRSCRAAPLPLAECEFIYGGLDLSGKTDLTSLILLGIKGKLASAHCYFWTPEKGLIDRAKRDRAPYDAWHKQGYLRTTPGATVDYEFVAGEIEEIVGALKIDGLAYDRWRMDILKKEFDKIGLSLPLVECGQGFKDMSPAIEALEKFILNKQLRHGDHPVLNMCAANAVVVSDAAKNRKMDKMKATGRIDGMVSLAMAAKLAQQQDTEENLDDFLLNPAIV